LCCNGWGQRGWQRPKRKAVAESLVKRPGQGKVTSRKWGACCAGLQCPVCSKEYAWARPAYHDPGRKGCIHRPWDQQVDVDPVWGPAAEQVNSGNGKRRAELRAGQGLWLQERTLAIGRAGLNRTALIRWHTVSPSQREALGKGDQRPLRCAVGGLCCIACEACAVDWATEG
jgi:hypothetical protein